MRTQARVAIEVVRTIQGGPLVYTLDLLRRVLPPTEELATLLSADS